MVDIGKDTLILNRLTGKVHSYKGVTMDGLMSCGCDMVDELKDTEHLLFINERIYEESIWEPADCMSEE